MKEFKIKVKTSDHDFNRVNPTRTLIVFHPLDDFCERHLGETFDVVYASEGCKYGYRIISEMYGDSGVLTIYDFLDELERMMYTPVYRVEVTSWVMSDPLIEWWDIPTADTSIAVARAMALYNEMRSEDPAPEDFTIKNIVVTNVTEEYD